MKKPIDTFSTTGKLNNCPVNSIEANTAKFFNHCLGRRSLKVIKVLRFICSYLLCFIIFFYPSAGFRWACRKSKLPPIIARSMISANSLPVLESVRALIPNNRENVQ